MHSYSEKIAGYYHELSVRQLLLHDDQGETDRGRRIGCVFLLLEGDPSSSHLTTAGYMYMRIE